MFRVHPDGGHTHCLAKDSENYDKSNYEAGTGPLSQSADLVCYCDMEGTQSVPRYIGINKYGG